jgi:hypothetical protein
MFSCIGFFLLYEKYIIAILSLQFYTSSKSLLLFFFNIVFPGPKNHVKGGVPVHYILTLLVV